MDLIFQTTKEDNTVVYNHIFQDTTTNCNNNNYNNNSIVNSIEEIVVMLLKNLINGKAVKFDISNNRKWNNIELTSNKVLTLKSNCSMRSVNFKQKRSKHRFVLIVNVLKEVHRLLLTGTFCTIRELYYRDPELILNQPNINNAVKDVSNILHETPDNLGLLSAVKGLVAGPLKILMMNGDIIDCSCSGPGLIPNDMNSVERLSTTASFVLVLEKETVFEKLISSNIFDKVDVILITGKGYPDTCTRILVQRLRNECNLPIYGLFDADPFGIEIMLVYKHGSMAGATDNKSCPQIRWLGIHPSELLLLPSIKLMKLNKKDCAKLKELLNRDYISYEVREELKSMSKSQLKAEIEGLDAISHEFLMDDYIKNKIKRNLFL